MVAPHSVGSRSEISRGEVAPFPVPPNMSSFLDHGVRDVGRWFVPLIVRLRPDVTLQDARSVLTAVTNQHDTLRLTVIEQRGMWEPHIAAPGEFSQLEHRALAPHATAGSPAERDAILAILTELVAGAGTSPGPVNAAYIAGGVDGPRCLAIAVHHLAADRASQRILMDDIVTAFGQQMAGQVICLKPVTTPWSEWSRRCAMLATQPTVLQTRDYWLDDAARAQLRVVDHDVFERPHADDLIRLSAPFSSVLTGELDGAQRELGMAADEILLAALGRAIARTIGAGVVAIDLARDGRSVLEPDVDLHRTVGWFTTMHPLSLTCATAQQASATTTLAAVRQALSAVPGDALGHGLLRYVYAPTALQLAAQPPSDVFFSYIGAVPEAPWRVGPAQFDADAALSVRETLPGLGHALQLRAYRTGGVLHLDWWYDSRRLNRSTAEELSEQFPLALIELTSEAVPPIPDGTGNAAEWGTHAPADLSSLDIAQVAGRD